MSNEITAEDQLNAWLHSLESRVKALEDAVIDLMEKDIHD